MKKPEYIQNSLPDDIALTIASSLELWDVCALGSCSRFWNDICGSDSIWMPSFRERWPSLYAFQQSSASATKGCWRSFYMKRHKEIARRAAGVVKFVEKCSSSGSLEGEAYLRAIHDLWLMQLGFGDVQVIFFKPELNVFINLVGFHYCINWLAVQAKLVKEAIERCKISERHVRIEWWKLDNEYYGFHWSDGWHHSCLVSLNDLATAKEEEASEADEEEVLAVLRQGADHGASRFKISVANSGHKRSPVVSNCTNTDWSCGYMRWIPKEEFTNKDG